MLNTPFSPWPSYTDEEANAVRRVLLSNRVNYWTGDECRQFEKEFAAWTGCDHAIALANGTVALDLALKCLGIGPGDEVIVTPRSFIASVSCVVNAGAAPVFVDVERDSGNITATSIAPAITPSTKAIICVHMAGWPCDMDPIMTLAREHGLFVIEDCAQAHGARYKGRAVGSIGHVGAWSFCQDKIMTTGGEGGMVTTNDADLWARMWSYKDHGKSHVAVARHHKPGFRWLHESFGTNWRMTELQAAIARIQLRRMAAMHAARTANAEHLVSSFKGLSALRMPFPPDGIEHAWYRLYAYVRPDELLSAWDRDALVAAITTAGVPCNVGSCPEIYLEKAFEGLPCRPVERLPVARELGDTALAFLVHPTLTAAEIDKTDQVVSMVCKDAVRRN